jgi:hypothetical protein
MIISEALRKSPGHPDARCMLNIAGVCGDETDSKTAGCILAHIRMSGEVGGAQKPDDICATFACVPCHNHFDNNGTTKGLTRGSEDWLYYGLRGMARTLRWWYDHGYLSIKGAK